MGTKWGHLRDIPLLIILAFSLFWYLMTCLGAAQVPRNHWVNHGTDYMLRELQKEEAGRGISSHDRDYTESAEVQIQSDRTEYR